MKKIIFILTITIILTGCENKHKNESTITNNNIVQIPEIEIYEDKNPVKVSLYKNSKKVTSYSTTISNFKDIAVFDVYYTDIDTVESSNTKTKYQLT